MKEAESRIHKAAKRGRESHTTTITTTSTSTTHSSSSSPQVPSVCQVSLSGFEPRASISRMLSLDYLGEAKRSL
ncbi:hypothetical protein EYF80_006543 [Liparis tanakae]|uniref:Uncharacterized protein n=1 Tax=Liparis tanakae TaxID=230148 RepID=A0A4Z2IZ08_9TELE|nr:hypothetical protein EYF80_006543 [Liparis tanakae]